MPDPRLKSWLQETFATQLQLGYRWFSEQHRKKHEGIKPDPDGHWVGLYEDNGSCVDIFNDIHPDDQSTVQIISIEPLTISDGEAYVEVTLTPKCERDLRKNHNGKQTAVDGLHSFVSVRRYTIRQTSYGPPRDQLRLILHAIDWQGSPDAGTGIPSGLRPVQSDEEIDTLLQQFKRTRSETDCRRSKLDEHRDIDTMSQSMDIFDGDSVMDTTPGTQMPFGTQFPQSPGQRRVESGPTISGTHSMEPVLAGNTQRKDLPTKKPIAAQQLLNLLNRSKPQSAIHRDSQREGFTDTQGMNFQHSKDISKSIETTADRNISPPREAIRSENGMNERPTTRTLDYEDITKAPYSIVPIDALAGAHEETHKHRSEDERQPHDGVDANKSEPDWMTGWILNHDTIKITSDQQSLLSKPESWQKPQPGHRFPDANIPIKILMELSRRSHESSASEEESEDESLADDDSGCQAEDESLPPPEPEEDLDQEIATSVVSWSQSSSPEPPQQSPQLNLPPDSSIDNGTMDFTQDVPNVRQAPTAPILPSQISLEINSSMEKEGADPPSSPPLAQEDEDSDGEMEMEMEISVSQGLEEDQPGPSTFQGAEHNYAPRFSGAESIVQVKETPYTKGKNGQSAPLEILPSSLQNQTSSGEVKDSSSAAIIYGTYSSQRPNVAIEGPSKDGLDTIAVNSSSQLATPHPGGGSTRLTFETGRHTHERKHVKFLSTEGNDVTTLEASSNPTPILKPSSYQPEIRLTLTPLPSDVENVPNRSAQSEPSPMSAQVPPQEPRSSDETSAPRSDHASNSHFQAVQPAHAEVATPSVPIKKRKFDNASSKKSSRYPKRREIKVVGFGGPLKSPQNAIQPPPAEAGHVHAKRAQAQDATSVDTDVSMDRSLPQLAPQTPKLRLPSYSPSLSSCTVTPTSQLVIVDKADTPKQSPSDIGGSHVTTPVVEERAIVPSVEEVSSRMALEQREATPDDPPSDLDTLMLDVHAISSTRPERPGIKESTIYPQVEHGLHSGLSFTTNALSLETKNNIAESADNTSLALPAQDQQLPTVFQKFRNAYPEYTGNAKHFTRMCKEMFDLDQEDKMVPKWQWDDYLIRRRIDYKAYVDECEEEGEQHEPYHRFYKDNIEDTLYRKGVLKNRAVLATALRELQTQPPVTLGAATPVPERAPQRMRRSLPSFNMLTQPKAVVASQRPRQSLPASQTPAASPGPRVPQPNSKSLLSSTVPSQPPARVKTRRTLPSAFQRTSSTSGDPIESSIPRGTPASKPRGHTIRSIDPSPLRYQSDGPSQLAHADPRTTESPLALPHLQQRTAQLARTSRTSSVSSVRSESRVSQLLASTPRGGKKSGGDEYGDWYKAHVRLKGFTGDSRVDDRVPTWPENLAVRRTVEVERKKGFDVLEWKDDL